MRTSLTTALVAACSSLLVGCPVDDVASELSGSTGSSESGGSGSTETSSETTGNETTGSTETSGETSGETSEGESSTESGSTATETSGETDETETGDGGCEACGPDEMCVEGECVMAVCGDGVVGGEEACDDGNDVDLDGCEPDCSFTVGAKQLAVGGAFTCVLQHNAQIVCWGENEYGALGHGHTEDLGDDELPSAAGRVEIGGPATAVVAGREHACALRDDGEVVCWGMSSLGRLGYGDLDIIGNNELPETVSVDLPAEVVALSAGPWTTCAITTDAQLLCWGKTGGDFFGDDEPAAAAPFIDAGGPVVEVAVTSSNICALLESGDVRCWGSSNALIGPGVNETIGDDEPASAAPLVDLGGPAESLAGGWRHACAIVEGGELLCWGGNNAGQLGYGNFGTVGDDEVPAAVGPVPLGAPVTEVALGLAHTCALTEGGDMLCWGSGAQGRLGYPGVMDFIGGSLVPADVGPIELPGPVDEIAVGDHHSCARLGLEVYCWGAGWSGQLGYGNLDPIGDDEPPASGGPIDFVGGEGHGVDVPADAFDGVTDARIFLRWDHPDPPEAFAPGQMLAIQGSYWYAFLCEDCTDSMVVRDAADDSLIGFAVNESDVPYPELGVLNMFGLTPQTWLAPFELSVSDQELCPPLESEGCTGARLSLDVDHMGETARLLDRTRGQVGAGVEVSVARLSAWNCGQFNSLAIHGIRQPCAPDCGPIDLIDACVPAGSDFDRLFIGFVSRPVDPGYDITCEVLDQSFDEQWRFDLDCLGLPPHD